jgi:hypothetical protein
MIYLGPLSVNRYPDIDNITDMALLINLLIPDNKDGLPYIGTDNG